MPKLKNPAAKAARLAADATSAFAQASADLEDANGLLAEAQQQAADDADALRRQATDKEQEALDAAIAMDRNTVIAERLAHLLP